ncbi:hypothetical protein PoB_000198700 [Plakobranchus ocellatus]|uniref:Uncharacterized protein n=1 Tax=Plakobranchus ocellatus TaxID=259542 RepID=A0AAV3XYF1_9GAST|nr:hypothetical protein PoB_000198700 [Plakobranchus ocellatus]
MVRPESRGHHSTVAGVQQYTSRRQGSTLLVQFTNFCFSDTQLCYIDGNGTWGGAWLSDLRIKKKSGQFYGPNRSIVKFLKCTKLLAHVARHTSYMTGVTRHARDSATSREMSVGVESGKEI